MREEDQIKAIMVAVFLLGLAGLIYAGCIPGLGGAGLSLSARSEPIWAVDYNATFYLNGTLDESLIYNSQGISRRLFRAWQYPLSEQSLGRPYVQILNRSHLPGAVAYERDWKGQIKIMKENGSLTSVPAMPAHLDYAGNVASLAEENEAGCYKPGYFSSGQQEIGYIFRIHPPVEYDDFNSHLNIKLADEHLPYDQVEIRIHDAEEYIERLFSHPNMPMEKRNNTWIITGRSPKDGLLEVEMLLRPEAVRLIEGFPRHVSDVEARTLSANSDIPKENSNSGFASSGDARVLKYTADLHLNGTLEERFVYRIGNSESIRMLYRTWKIPLSQEKQDSPYVELLKINAPPGTIPYAKMVGTTRILAYNGTFYSPIQYDLWSTAKAIVAEKNEAGYYLKGGAPRYSQASYRAQIHPSLLCDGKSCLFSLDLSERRLPFRNINLRVHDPEGNISRIFVNPLQGVRRDGPDWIVSGESTYYNPLQIKVLMDSSAASAMQGFIQPSQDVRGRALQEEASAAGNRAAISSASTILAAVFRLMVLAAPLLLLLVYRRYGRERSFLVPAVLSTVPCQRKPWLVNQIFKGTPFDFDEDGFYATILDLQRRKLLDMQSDASGIKITLLGGNAAEDSYEEKVLDFLKKHANKGVLDSHDLSAKIESLRARGYDDESARKSLYDLRDDMLDLKAGPGEDIGHEFFSLHYRQRSMLVAVPLALMVATGILVFPMEDLYPQIRICFFASMLLFLQSLIPAAIAPQVVFGRWKDDYYREKQEWDAFRAFLGDYAMMQKYAPQDLAIWREWLVYGTALGVGDSVARVLENLKIPVIAEAASLASFSHLYDHSYERASQHVPTREEEHSGSSGGGDFGGGGGCGGGGGGAR